MKTIQPVQSWNNGQKVEATILNAYVISDNLTSDASFYYSLLTAELNKIAEGNLVMNGNDYTDYETNLYAWDWVASSLRLTITGEYVPPAPVVEPIVENTILAEPIAEAPIVTN
jgi:hypothetical protein